MSGEDEMDLSRWDRQRRDEERAPRLLFVGVMTVERMDAHARLTATLPVHTRNANCLETAFVPMPT